MASTWSWVTKTKVAPRRVCRSFNSARSWVRSFASRFDKRLVEKENRRLPHDGAAHGDALALTARKRARLAVEILLDLEHARGLGDPLFDLVARHALIAQPVFHVPRTDMCG
jgi:hypothetical protein